MAILSRNSGNLTRLRARITCPHCWHNFPPEDTLWISTHPDLQGDPVVGEDALKRFLPTRFNAQGHALDAKGTACRHLACPHCHLSVPRALLEMQALFVSIIGAPAAGKSYFLTAMTWRLRNRLQRRFRLGFHDADATANQKLTEYEELLFQNPEDGELVVLPKTEPTGELYESVRINGRGVSYPKPFVFSIQPMESHPGFSKRGLHSRVLCLYDNAGEHFLPGYESTGGLATQHLALSKALLFVFDPTQHAMLRKSCRRVTLDPQVQIRGRVQPQHQVLHAAANRIRDYSGLSQNQKYPHPLVVVVNKFDAWIGLTRIKRLRTDHVVRRSSEGMAALDLERLQAVSDQVRSVLDRGAQDIIAAAESFASHVIYIPVSSLGRSPELDETSGSLPIRPRDIRPMWAEIPMLYVLSQVTQGLVRSGHDRSGH